MFLKNTIVIGSMITILGFSGCTQKSPSYRLGQFTMASSNNVRNIYYSMEDKTKAGTEGEDCHVVGVQPNDSRLQRAMDNAIKNGQEKGIDGDLLVNVRIDQEQVNRNTGFLGTPQVYNCITVKGDLVKIKK